MTTNDETREEDCTTIEAAIGAQREVLAAAQRQTLTRALATLEIAKVLVSSGASKARVRECQKYARVDARLGNAVASIASS